MAKRPKDETEIDPRMFFQQQGDQTGQLGLLLKLLGMDDDKGLERGKLGLDREELEARLGLEQSKQGLEERKLKAEEKRAGETEAYRTWEKQQKAIDRDEERKYKRDALESEARKSRDAFNIEAYRLAPDKDKPTYLKNMSEEGRKTVLELEALQQGKTARDVAPAIEAAYKKGDWDTIKQITGTLSPETMARPEFDWQKWNQGAAGATPSTETKSAAGGRGLLGLLWNTPAVLQNVGKGIANVVSGAAMGEGAPQAKYTKFTDPVKELQARVGGTAPTEPVRSEAPLGWVVDAIQERGSRPVSFIQHDAPPDYEPNAGIPRQMNVDQVLGMLGNPVAPAPVAEAPVEGSGFSADALLRMIQEEREKNLSATRMGP